MSEHIVSIKNNAVDAKVPSTAIIKHLCKVGSNVHKLYIIPNMLSTTVIHSEGMHAYFQALNVHFSFVN